MGLFKRQVNFILYGFIFWLPVVLVIWIAVLLLSNAENVGRAILGVVVADKYVYSGFGIILCIVIVYLSGMLLKLTKLGNVLSKIPFVGVFFGKGEMMSIARLGHMQPCLFLYSSTCTSYGWVLSEEKVKLGEDNAVFGMINVYFPNVPTLMTGQVFAARRDTVMKLGNSSTEIISLMLYAVRSPAALEYLPWQDESRVEFEERSKLFGLK